MLKLKILILQFEKKMKGLRAHAVAFGKAATFVWDGQFAIAMDLKLG